MRKKLILWKYICSRIINKQSNRYSGDLHLLWVCLHCLWVWFHVSRSVGWDPVPFALFHFVLFAGFSWGHRRAFGAGTMTCYARCEQTAPDSGLQTVRIQDRPDPPWTLSFFCPTVNVFLTNRRLQEVDQPSASVGLSWNKNKNSTTQVQKLDWFTFSLIPKSSESLKHRKSPAAGSIQPPPPLTPHPPMVWVFV